MARRPLAIFATLGLAAVAFAGTLVPQAAAVGRTSAVKLPVVACPTTRGLPGHPKPAYPKELAPEAVVSSATALEYYSDNVRSLTPILAPRGWRCQVQVGADGGAGINVYPPGGTPTSKKAITLQYEPACQGCMYGLICSLLPKVARHFDSGAYADFKCTKRPRRESVDWIRGSPDKTGVTNDIVGFEDPAGVKGDGVPSGGKWPANGVLLYKSTKAANAAAVDTCALPSTEQARCTAILDDFIKRDWGMPPNQV